MTRSCSAPTIEEELTADLKALEDKSSDQLVVVTLPSLQGYAIEDYGYQLGRHWGIGTKQAQQRRPPHRRAQRAQGPHRGRPRARADPHRRAVEDHHRQCHPAAVPRRRFCRRHQGRRARHHAGADRRRHRGRGARQSPRLTPTSPTIDWLMVIFWVLMLSWIAYSVYRSARYASTTGRGQRRAGRSSCRARLGGRLEQRRLEQRWRLLRRRRKLRWRRRLRGLVGTPDAALHHMRSAPRSTPPLPAPRRRRAARSWSSWRRARTAITRSRCCGRRCSRSPYRCRSFCSRNCPVEYIYLASALGVRRCVARCPMGAAPPRGDAELGQARPRPSEGRRAVPRAEPAHHQRPHRRAHLRFLRRALRRGDRRRRHLQEGTPIVWEAGHRRADQSSRQRHAREGFITAIGMCGKVLAEHFPPGRRRQGRAAATT